MWKRQGYEPSAFALLVGRNMNKRKAIDLTIHKLKDVIKESFRNFEKTRAKFAVKCALCHKYGVTGWTQTYCFCCPWYQTYGNTPCYHHCAFIRVINGKFPAKSEFRRDVKELITMVEKLSL